MNAKLEDELRVALNARADAVPHSVDPWALTSAAIRTDRRLRRTRAAGGLVAVLALGLAIPTVLDATDSRKPEPAQTITIQPGPAITGGIQSWTDARGSLANDASAMRAIRKRFADADQEGTVIYAGDVGFDRVAFLRSAGSPDTYSSPFAIQSLVGPAGSAVADLLLDQPLQIQGDEPTFTWGHQRAGVANPMVLLTSSDTATARISDEPRYSPNGSVTRDYRTVKLTNGAWSGEAGPKGAQLVRVDMAGGGPLQALSRVGTPTPPRAESGSGISYVDNMLADLLLAHQLRPEDVRTTGVVNEAVPVSAMDAPQPRGSKVRLYLAVFKVADGTAFRSATLVSDQPGVGGIVMSLLNGAPVPAGAPERQPFYWLSGSPTPGGSTASSQVFVMAPGAATVGLTTRVDDSPDQVVVTMKANTHGLATAQIAGSRLQLLKGQLPKVQLRVVTADASGKRTGDWPAHLPSDQDPLLMFTQ